MSASGNHAECDQIDQVHSYALGSLPDDQMRVVEAHLRHCAGCREEVELLRPVIDSFHEWPTDVLKPSGSLWDRLVDRIGPQAVESYETSALRWSEPQWNVVGSGIYYKILATDAVRNRLTMLVRLAPGAAYPPHRHAGDEILHLLHGELWIDDRKLYAGDYNRSEMGTTDQRVWSETGCTCVLITSPQDVLLVNDSPT